MIDDRPQARATRIPVRRLMVVVGVLAGLALPALAPGVTVSRQSEAVRQLESELASLDARYGQAASAYATANARLTDVRNRIDANERARKDAARELRNAQRELALRLSAAYRQPQPSALEVLLRSGSLSDALSRVDLIRRVQRQDAEVIDEISAARVRLRNAARQLEVDKVAAKKEAQETASQLGQVQSIRSARRARLIAARSQLAVLIAQAEQARDRSRLVALRGAQDRVNRGIGQNSPGTPPPATAPQPSPTPAPAGDVSSILRKIALCESGGNPKAVSPSGTYRGKYQFDQQTWKAYGGSTDLPDQASEAEQDAVAARLLAARGTAPWPVCGR